jgi:hypothetical protein
MKPQTMLEFVLSQCDIGMEVQSMRHQTTDRASRFCKIENYAKFLAQKPELWMFVPTDDKGNVLEEPKDEMFNTGNLRTYYNNRCNYFNQYQEAIDRVIFDGFTFSYNWLKNKYLYFPLRRFDTIEQLINEHSIVLTLKKPII